LNETAAAQTEAKVALVTGGSRGIGCAIVDRFLAEGWRVYAAARNPPAAAPGLTPLTLDIGNADSCAAAIATVARHGRLDALINNAAIYRYGTCEELDDRAWQDLMAVNLFGPMRLTRLALPLLRRRGGTVVMLSSLSAHAGLPGDGAYAASKFALAGASESLSYEVAPFGVRVVLVEPGAVATEFVESPAAPMHPDYARLHSMLRAGAREPHGMAPAEVAQTVWSAVADDAPDFRIAAGAQAQAVKTRLEGLAGAARRDWIVENLGFREWIDNAGKGR